MSGWIRQDGTWWATAADAEHMRALGHHLAAVLRPGDVVVLDGPLGAGKTTLTQGIGEALGVRGPVTSPTFVIARQHPGPRVGMVHVDAYRLGGSVEDVTIAEAKALFETNVFGAMRTVKAVAPVMRGQKSGLIIFVSSIGGLIGLPFQGLYSSTKFAVEGLAEAMSMELRPFGVDVVIAEPGDFATGFTANRVKAVASESADSGYKEAYKRAMRNIEKDENSGYKPDVFAIAISRIINSRRRKLRYMIGSPLQKSSVFIKKVLPSRLFERIMAWYYTGSR